MLVGGRGARLVARGRVGVVVVEQRVGRVVELACLVVGEPGGATVGRIGEDRHTVVVGDRWCARAVALGLCGITRGCLPGERLLPAGRIRWAGGRVGAPRWGRGWLAGGVLALALEFALEAGRGLPVAKGAGGDVDDSAFESDADKVVGGEIHVHIDAEHLETQAKSPTQVHDDQPEAFTEDPDPAGALP